MTCSVNMNMLAANGMGGPLRLSLLRKIELQTVYAGNPSLTTPLQPFGFPFFSPNIAYSPPQQVPTRPHSHPD